MSGVAKEPALQGRALTAPGVAAIAVVRIWGPEAAAFLGARLRPASGTPIFHRAGDVAFGAPRGRLPEPGRLKRMTWVEAGTATDDVIVVQLPAEAGGGFEVHCHGGTAGLNLWRDGVLRAGGQWRVERPPEVAGAPQVLTTPEDWAMDFGRVWQRVRTEAQARVVAASAHAVAMQFRAEPAIAKWPRAVVDELLVQRLARLRLLTPAKVLIAGPVNAGKSTLLNALLADARALTSAEPGTTRDTVEAQVEIGGLVVTLVDSAGLRDNAGEQANAVEQRGIARTRETQAQVELTVWLSPVDAPVAPPAGWVNSLVVHSKSDLKASGTLQPAPGLTISAHTGAGIDELRAAIVQRLWPADAGRVGEVVPGACTPAQVATLQTLLR
ncbi:MAG TPA: GTPase [Planctomycetota bacterium]|nr:GTPase [Planctomycetota bacterium]